MKILKKEEGRIPFAYVFAIIFVLMLLLTGIYATILGQHDVISVRKFYEEADQHLRNVQNMVREKAYHIVMEVIHNITKKRDPKLYMIQYYTFQNFSRYINKTFPLVTSDYNVTVGNYSIKVVMNYKKVRDFIKNYKLTWVDFSYMLDNLREGYENHTQIPVYPYVVGFVNYTYHDRRTGYIYNRTMRFNRIIYSPLPMLKFAFDEFNTSTTNLGDFGRLVRYILTTVAEYRTLQGYASGGYDRLEIPVTYLLTKSDVEKAVNLALLLESVRFFHSYDPQTVDALGIRGIIEKYLYNGTIDAADIYYMWTKMGLLGNLVLSGKIIGQSIYGYADRFVYELMRLFWGDLADQYFADPTLKEPIVSWDAIKKKGESFARGMLHAYLAKWREWLHIPRFILPHKASADLSYKFIIVVIIPGIPPKVLIFHKTAKMKWYVWNMPVMDTIDLILDEKSKRKKFTLMTLGINTDVPFVYYGDYHYDLVKESLVDEHKNYGNLGNPYINTLKYVIDALTRSMKKRSDTWNDVENKGLIDYAAYETSLVMPIGSSGVSANPRDTNTILIDGSKDMIYGPIKREVNVYKVMLTLRKETWWADGAYKEYKNSTDSDAYLYYLTKDTVDLWYQAMKNLYDGGDPSPSDDAGPYDSDCNSRPPSNQESTWPYGYSGYPFHGSLHNGSFNFHRDLTKDAYNDMRLLMWEMAIKKGLEEGGIGFPIYDKEELWDTVKKQTEDARQKVVGKYGLIKDLNMLFPYFYFNPISFNATSFSNLRGFLDFITDTGSYKSNFYCLVRWRIGMKIIGLRGPGGCPPKIPKHNGTGNNTNMTNGSLGLDVSHYQGNIDWTKVYNAGYRFAFVKATDGATYRDPLFSTNIRNGAAAGLMMGAYHFARPTRHSPIVEADHFVSVIRPYMSLMQLPPALDLEKGESMGWSALSNWAERFMEEVQSQLGVTPVIYLNKNYARHLDSSLTKYPLWIADYTYNPNATPNTEKWSTWEYWQFSDRGRVPGISSSRVDLDKYNGYKAMATMLRARSFYNGLMGDMEDWLSESYDVLYKNIVLNARYSSIPIFPYMHVGTYHFWDTSYPVDKALGRTENETIAVDFSPDYLSGLSISISLGAGHRFVDVQDIDYPMGNAPFEYQYDISISGKININLMTPRTSLVYGGHHWRTWYNDTVNINLHIKVPIYSAWFLESHWNSCTAKDNWAFHTDVPFSYTRGYFGVVGKDKKTKPFFISRELNTFIYDYEEVGELWNRFSTFEHFAMADIKDEMAGWNYTYKDIVLGAAKDTANAYLNASRQLSVVARDHQALCSKASAYVHGLNFFYFERNFGITKENVTENNGYQTYTYNFGSQAVSEKYSEKGYHFTGTISSGGVSLRMQEIYDGINIQANINSGALDYQIASYSNTVHRGFKMQVEGNHNIYILDFGFVGSSGAVSSLTKYFPKLTKRSMSQEELIGIFHKLLKDVYVNESLNYKFGIFVNLKSRVNGNLMYIIWYDGNPTPDSFVIWLNNEVRSIIYILGMSHLSEHAYDMLTNENVYFSLNGLWLDTNYESSSIFGYRAHGNFRGSSEGYVITANYNIDVPTPDTGHGPS